MTSPLTGDRRFSDDVVRIANLTVRSPVIDGYTFTNCTIVGPAVLALVHDVSLVDLRVEGDINSLFWEIDPATRPVVFGAVAVQNTTFSACTFQAIGFAGTPEIRQRMAQMFIDPPPTA